MDDRKKTINESQTINHEFLISLVLFTSNSLLLSNAATQWKTLLFAGGIQLKEKTSKLTGSLEKSANEIQMNLNTIFHSIQIFYC